MMLFAFFEHQILIINFSYQQIGYWFSVYLFNLSIYLIFVMISFCYFWGGSAQHMLTVAYSTIVHFASSLCTKWRDKETPETRRTFRSGIGGELNSETDECYSCTVEPNQPIPGKRVFTSQALVRRCCVRVTAVVDVRILPRWGKWTQKIQNSCLRKR